LNVARHRACWDAVRRKERGVVCCDNLVCASCSRPVVEAGCGICRAARAELHGRQPLPMATFLVVLAALLALAVLLTAR
jgi:hypothetical protein